MPATDVAQLDADLVAFVTAHYDRLLGLARLICRDTSDAADAVQNGLEQAWRGRASLRDPERTRQWLDRIVAREAVRVSKRRGSWWSRLVSSDAHVKWADPADPRATDASISSALRAGFERLSADQRAVVVLHLHAGYSVAETAAMVAAPEETVRSRLRLARQRLRQELEGADA